MAELAPDIPRPPHAYVPGRSPRHPEDWFDGIKCSVSAQMQPEAMARSQAFAAGLVYYQQGYFWECHEVLEAVWMALPNGTPERRLLQALIQLANARLKLKMGRPKAAARLCDITQSHLEALDGANLILGVEAGALHEEIHQIRSLVNVYYIA